MSLPTVQQLARNNAGWCNAVCQARGTGGRFTDRLWQCDGTPPPYYPNIITLMPSPPTSLEALDAAVVDVRARAGQVSVKDSFGDADLHRRGFRVLFEAQWLVHSPQLHQGAAPANGIEWHTVESTRDLEAWQEAWDPEITRTDRVFAPSLLADPSIVFMAAQRGIEIDAGAIANHHAGVVGLSNFFCRTADAAAILSGFLLMASRRYPQLTFASYERAVGAAPYLEAGFSAVAPLRVWVSDRAS